MCRCISYWKRWVSIAMLVYRRVTGNSPFSEDRKYSTSTHSWWTFQRSCYFFGVENIPADDACIIRSGSIPRILSLIFRSLKISSSKRTRSKNVCLIYPKNKILTPQKWLFFLRTKTNTPASYRFNPCIGRSNDFFDNKTTPRWVRSNRSGSVRISDFSFSFLGLQ